MAIQVNEKVSVTIDGEKKNLLITVALPSDREGWKKLPLSNEGKVYHVAPFIRGASLEYMGMKLTLGLMVPKGTHDAWKQTAEAVETHNQQQELLAALKKENEELKQMMLQLMEKIK